MNQAKKQPLELLAPARDLVTAKEAILHGADAVYIGAPSHGARSRATNSLADLRELVEFARPYGVKIYVTVNTIVYDREITEVEKMVAELYNIGVDALIVQDMALLEMNIPPIPLHASTQCDTRTPEKARLLEACGFEQIVVARELGLEELRAVCEAVSVPVEAFVHGALCVCYSGDCQASYVQNGRSANRGECAQMCRLPYDLLDSDGKVLGRQKHYLSLKDMRRIESLAEMADAGVRSFKIEGRLKDAAYVKNVVAAYRRALDKVIAANPDRYYRPSRGETVAAFEPQLNKAFNREFTPYFLRKGDNARLACFDTPKALGEMVGEVADSRGKQIEAKLSMPLANGDGLSYITPDGRAGGFRVNRAEGSRLLLQEGVQLPKGTRLFRSFDKLWEDKMASATARRLIAVDMSVRVSEESGAVVLSGSIEGLGQVSVSIVCELQRANKPDGGFRRSQLSKLGGTIFAIADFVDEVGDRFVPASVLSALRRDLVAALMGRLQCAAAAPVACFRDVAPVPSDLFEGQKIDRHANVANQLARKFYMSHGATEIADAIEVAGQKGSGLRVMTTRYCLRRELGKCLKTTPCSVEKRPLYLRGANFTYRLDFDCKNCQMTVTTV